MLIIGIAGGTGSGKTTVVRKIIESLPAGQTAVIPQDSYYWDSSHIPVEERQNINFDEPAAIDFDLLVKHLKELKAGHSIEQPIYSFLTCTRSNETITVEPRDIVIVEGILILCNEELRNMMDMKYSSMQMPTTDLSESSIGILSNEDVRSRWLSNATNGF